MDYNPDVAYDALPELPPTADVESREVMRACVQAARALAEVKGAGEKIPNQAMLINAIPLQEAKLSSEVENIVTTQDDLFLGATDEASVKDPHTKEVLRYRAALRLGYERLRGQPLDLGLIRAVCSTLLDEDVQFRPAGKGVRIFNHATGRTAYTPPMGGPNMFSKLENLESYLLAEDGPDPLIRMAVAHYQFEAIHPFSDGNGRTGRILNILYLLHTGLLDIPVLYMSRFILGNKQNYYQLLQSVTKDGAWEPWLLYMLRGVEQTASWTTSRIDAIRELFDSTVELCRGEAPKIYSKELMELVFSQPYCKIAFLVESGIAKRQTASEYLQELQRIGILEPEKRGREVVYKHPALIEVLSA